MLKKFFIVSGAVVLLSGLVFSKDTITRRNNYKQNRDPALKEYFRSTYCLSRRRLIKRLGAGIVLLVVPFIKDLIK